jgi:hypothetical protein
VYKFVPDANGNPSFTLVSQTSDSGSGRVGAGVPVVTTYNGTPDTAILWITDPDAGLRAYYAVPQVCYPPSCVMREVSDTFSLMDR